jgi:hypothetical protein
MEPLFTSFFTTDHQLSVLVREHPLKKKKKNSPIVLLALEAFGNVALVAQYGLLSIDVLDRVHVIETLSLLAEWAYFCL